MLNFISSARRIGLLGAVVLNSTLAMAGTPDPVITVKTTLNGYATIGGSLTEKPSAPVGISVTNGNVKSSTVSDSEGKWSVVIQIRSSSVSVESWSLFNSSEHSEIVESAL